MKAPTNILPVAITPRRRWLAVAWDVFILVALVYFIVAFTGVREDRDNWRAIAETVMVAAKPEQPVYPAPGEVCPAWWFGSKDLAASRKRICR